MEEALSNLVEFFKAVSPEVWSVLIKQAYMEAITKLIWSVVFVLLIITTYKIRNKFEELEDNQWAVWTLITIFGIVSLHLLISSIQWFANPEFYAIRWLLQQIP